MQSMTRLDQLIVEVENPEHEDKRCTILRQQQWILFEGLELRRNNVPSQFSSDLN